MPTIIATIADQGVALNPSELAEFLYLFRATNLALDRVVPAQSRAIYREPTAVEIESYRQRIGACSPGEVDSYFAPHAAPDLLRIKRITQSSPLEIVFTGCAVLLALAVVFSGGTLSFSRTALRAQLPPLGKGVRCLRAALGLDKTLRAEFGIRETCIKLNKDQFEALMAPTTGTGGFQHFLKGLQYRVNKQTRQLVLSPQDLEKVYRYKADPKRGGWQGRFEKVFGRHFPDDHRC